MYRLVEKKLSSKWKEYIVTEDIYCLNNRVLSLRETGVKIR